MKHLEALNESWEYSPSIGELNNLPAMGDVWKGIEIEFIPHKNRGTESRSMYVLNRDPEIRTRTYIFYPKKSRIEDGRYITINNIKMGSLDEWNLAIKEFVYYQAALELNEVKNDNDPTVAYRGDDKRTFNRNKIANLRMGIGLPDVLGKQIFWDSPITKNILIWLLPDSTDLILEIINKMLDKGILINYDLFFKELVLQNKLSDQSISTFDLDRAKKLTKANNLIKRNAVPLVPRQERIDIRNQENFRGYIDPI